MQILIPEFVKRNFLLLSLYIAFHVEISILKSIFAKVLLSTFIFVFLLYQFFPVVRFFSFTFTKLAFLTFFYFIIHPLVTALEESLHMGICIQQGKSNFIEKLVITYLSTQKKHYIIMMSVATKFRGNFKISEKIQIHGGSPLLILLILCVILVLGLLTTEMPVVNFLRYWMIFAIFPTSSLFPFKFVLESDGYCILKDAKRFRFSPPRLIRELLYGVLYGLRYLFLGSSKIRKYSNSAINNQAKNVFEWVKKSDFKNALSELEKELQSNPNEPDIFNNIAWCYSELGIEIDKAINLAQKAVNLNPDKATFHDTLGWCYFKKGDIDNAKRSMVLAITIDPHNLLFQKHLKEIENETSKTKGSNQLRYKVENDIYSL